MSLKLAGTAISREPGSRPVYQRPARPAPSGSRAKAQSPSKHFRSRVAVSWGRSMSDLHREGRHVVTDHHGTLGAAARAAAAGAAPDIAGEPGGPAAPG